MPYQFTEPFLIAPDQIKKSKSIISANVDKIEKKIILGAIVIWKNDYLGKGFSIFNFTPLIHNEINDVNDISFLKPNQRGISIWNS